jgi:glyoxylase-like metal-dependent hydrolase (beta-lactamase superfamily II)
VTVRRISVPVRTRAPTGETAAYVVGDGDGLLVDPPDWTDGLAESVREAGVSHLAVTHHHPDHVGGVSGAVDALDVTVWALAGREAAFASATGVEPDRAIRPGERIPAADGVTVLDTPGHAPEHLAFAVGDALISGDLAVASGSVVVGAPDGDMRAYLSSLRRVHARNPTHLYPGHGPVVDEPRTVCQRLIEHRLARERSVAVAVASGAQTADEILDAAYEKDVSAVRDLARATVVAHLEKLAVEGKVEWDGATARPG